MKTAGTAILLTALAIGSATYAQQSVPDFSGHWRALPNTGNGSAVPFTITQTEKLFVTDQKGEGILEYRLDGTETTRPEVFEGQRLTLRSKLSWDAHALVLTQ